MKLKKNEITKLVILLVLFMLCLLKTGFRYELPMYILFTGSLFILSITDIDRMIIPDECLAIPVLGWVIFNILLRTGYKILLARLASALLFGALMLLVTLIMNKILNRKTLGGGDVKLIMVSILYLGAVGGMFALLIGCFIGIIVNILCKLKGRNGTANEYIEQSKVFPFGPAISTGIFIMLLYGEPLIAWYLK